MHFAPQHFLDRDTSGSRLMAHARLLVKLSRRFAAIAPGPFRHAVRVANFKNGLLVLHVDSGAIAVKLRQMSQRLAAQMTQGGVECSGIEVKVMPRQYLREVHPAHVKPLSAKASQALQATAAQLPPGRLREALETLLQRAATAE